MGGDGESRLRSTEWASNIENKNNDSTFFQEILAAKKQKRRSVCNEQGWMNHVTVKSKSKKLIVN